MDLSKSGWFDDSTTVRGNAPAPVDGRSWRRCRNQNVWPQKRIKVISIASNWKLPCLSSAGPSFLLDSSGMLFRDVTEYFKIGEKKLRGDAAAALTLF